MTDSETTRTWMRGVVGEIAVDAVAWFAIQGAAGYAVHRMPQRRLDRDTWLTRARPWERGGAFYADRLAIRRWKRFLPEAGALFPGGFDKRRLGPTRAEQLERHVIETRRAEIGHWLAVLPAPVFWWWNRRWLAVVMSAYALAINGPCIAAQRYNRLRLLRVLARQDPGTVTDATGVGVRGRAKGSRGDEAARSRSSRGTSGSSIP